MNLDPRKYKGPHALGANNLAALNAVGGVILTPLQERQLLLNKLQEANDTLRNTYRNLVIMGACGAVIGAALPGVGIGGVIVLCMMAMIHLLNHGAPPPSFSE